jgi:hypothetical protein
MITNFARKVWKKEVGKGWVDRFVARNKKDQLITKWSSGMDRNRHEADSEQKYSLYFDLLEWNISEYSVLNTQSSQRIPTVTYNMDEKGLMIGKTGRSKRVFSRTFVRCEVLFGIKPRAYQELVRLCRCPSLWKTTR